MKETRRIDLWVGRGAAIAGIVYVLTASLRPMDVADRRARRTVTATVVRCPERSRLRGVAFVAATCVAAIVAALFVTIHSFVAGPDDWALPLTRAILAAY